MKTAEEWDYVICEHRRGITEIIRAIQADARESALSEATETIQAWARKLEPNPQWAVEHDLLREVCGEIRALKEGATAPTTAANEE